MPNVTGGQNSKGWFARIENGKIASVYNFMYNPTEWERGVSAAYMMVSPPGSSLPTAYFIATTGSEISMTLFLDATTRYSSDKEGVMADIFELNSYVLPVSSSITGELDQFVTPPMVKFGRGNDVRNVVFTNVSARITRENTFGFPTQARVDLSFHEVYTGPEDFSLQMRRLERLREHAVIKDNAAIPKE